MEIKATATADVTNWNEQDYDRPDGQPRLAQLEFGYAYRGDLEAEGSARGQLVYRDADTAEFTALERVSGRIGDRSGTFVVRTGGLFENGAITYEWSVVPGTATGGLEGLSGSGEMVWVHGESGNLTFAYHLPSTPTGS